MALKDKLLVAMDTGSISILILLDFSAAFNAVDLLAYGVDGSHFNIALSFFSSKPWRMEMGNFYPSPKTFTCAVL